jgi:hypothetical protein
MAQNEPIVPFETPVDEKNPVLSVIKRDDNNVLTNVVEKSMSVVQLLQNISLITPADGKKLEEAKEFILSNYTQVPEFRPFAVKISSVLNDGQFPTEDLKYWQCKKEAEVHFNQLITEFFKYERCKVDVEEIDYTISSLENSKKYDDNVQNIKGIDPIKVDFEIRRLAIKREEYLFNMKHLEKSIKYRISEVHDWFTISNRLNCKYDRNSYESGLVEGLYRKYKKTYEDAGDLHKENARAQLDTLLRLLDINQK